MFRIRIVTPEGFYTEDEVAILNIVTPEGEMGILENHIPVVASLEISIISTDNGTRKYYSIGEGTLQFHNNLALLLVDSCEAESEIYVERPLEAEKRAEKRIQSEDHRVDLTRAQKALKRARTRLKLRGRY